MLVAKIAGAVLALASAAPNSPASATERDARAYQGAWLSEGSDCAKVYSFSGKSPSFKRPVNIFAPAFIVSGNRLKTPMAICRIKSVKPPKDRQVLDLDCANMVSGNEVRVFMALSDDGALLRYSNEKDTAATRYQRCSR